MNLLPLMHNMEIMSITSIIELLRGLNKVAGTKVPGNSMWLNPCEFILFSAYSGFTLDYVFNSRTLLLLSHRIILLLTQQSFQQCPKVRKSDCLKRSNMLGLEQGVKLWISPMQSQLSHPPLSDDGFPVSLTP